MSRALSYRTGRANDLEQAYGLSSSLGWPHRPEEWRFAANTGQIVVAEDGTAIVGTAVFWKFGAGSATVGLVMSSPQYAQCDVERVLMDRISEETGERSVVLNAPTDRVEAYMQQEFVLTGSVEQFQGAVHRASEVFPVAGERLRPLCKSDLPRLIELASRGSGFDRDGLLPLLLDSSSGIGLERNGALMGFALFRRFGRGYAIGPVITPVVRSVDNGECLVRYLLRRFEGVLLRIDLPSGSALGAQLLKLGLQHVDTVHTMVKNRAPRSDGHFQQVALISHSLC